MRIGPGLGLGSSRSGVTPPASFSWITAWSRAAYPGTPWPGVSGAGASSLHNFSQATNAPAAGTALNGRATANFVMAGTKYLETDAIASTFITGAAGYAAALINPTTKPADSGAATPFLEGAVIMDAGAFWCMVISTSGMRAGITNGGWQATAYQACPTATWSLAQMRWNGTVLESRINRAAWSTVAVGNVTNMASKIQLGRNGSGGTYLDGLGAEFILGNARPSDAEANSIVDYINIYHGLAL